MTSWGELWRRWFPREKTLTDADKLQIEALVRQKTNEPILNIILHREDQWLVQTGMTEMRAGRKVGGGDLWVVTKCGDEWLLDEERGCWNT